MSQSICFSRGFLKKTTNSIIPRGLDPWWLDLRDSCTSETCPTLTWVRKRGAGKEENKGSLVWQISVLPGNGGWITLCVWQSWTCDQFLFPSSILV